MTKQAVVNKRGAKKPGEKVILNSSQNLNMLNA